MKSTRAREGSESESEVSGFIRGVKTLEPLMRERRADETAYGWPPAGGSGVVSASSSELSRSVMTMPVGVVNATCGLTKNVERKRTIFFWLVGRRLMHVNVRERRADAGRLLDDRPNNVKDRDISVRIHVRVCLGIE